MSNRVRCEWILLMWRWRLRVRIAIWPIEIVHNRSRVHRVSDFRSLIIVACFTSDRYVLRRRRRRRERLSDQQQFSYQKSFVLKFKRVECFLPDKGSEFTIWCGKSLPFPAVHPHWICRPTDGGKDKPKGKLFFGLICKFIHCSKKLGERYSGNP